MEFRQLPAHLAETVSNFLTNGPAAVPLWAAVMWLVLLIYRKRATKCFCLLVGIDDPYLIQDVIKRVDISFALLLIALAVLPFLALAPGSFTPEMVRVGSLLAAFMAVHIFIQGADIILSRWYLAKRHTPVPAVFRSSILTIIYLVIVLLLLDWTLGVNVIPLLATSSVIAAVLGLALQDTLRNIFAGLTMTVEKSVKQGDWINFRIDGDNTRIGQVMEIGWRSTKVRTLNNNVAVIPNTMFIQNELVNYDSPSPTNGKVVDFPVSIALEPAQVLQALSESVTAVEGILAEPVPASCAREVKIDQVIYQVRFWTDGIQKQEAITSKVIEAALGKLAKLQSAAPKAEKSGE